MQNYFLCVFWLFLFLKLILLFMRLPVQYKTCLSAWRSVHPTQFNMISMNRCRIGSAIRSRPPSMNETGHYGILRSGNIQTGVSTSWARVQTSEHLLRRAVRLVGCKVVVRRQHHASVKNILVISDVPLPWNP